MDKTFSPKAIEQQCITKWQQNLEYNLESTAKPFCIMLPPPNVTGSLHMGHAFQDTMMDILIRFNRMQGNNTHWQMGIDHAGIATQMVVERQLQQQNISRHDLGREEFVKKVWQWKESSGGNIQKQMNKLGTSGDWDSHAFTMDEARSQSVKKAFVDLHNQGLIYRGVRLVNWDPILKTAISDLEVEQHEEQGSLWHIKYQLTDGSNHITIATTRPETLLGDVAVAVHPEDSRYKNLIGKTVTLPIVNREIPILADEMVEQEFGSGCVKITPAHDFNDYAVGKRHQLEMINIFTDEAHLNENTPKHLQGLSWEKARKKVLEELTELNLLVKEETHTLKVPRGDRSGALIQPYLTPQWFVKIAPLAEPAIDAVKTGKIKFEPAQYANMYFDWMNKIEDWCISRQLWWGHRIPAWYDENGKVYVAEDEQSVRTKYKLTNNIILTQDDDVLDTWFSSALWPFATLGWPQQTKTLQTFYPTSVLVTGFDIIFFWVARMIMFGMKFMQDVPFHTVYIHGLILDKNGQKMSKSKGNVLDPIDIIEGISLDELVKKRTISLMLPKQKQAIEKQTRKDYPEGIAAYGCDALRFTFAALASQQRHIRFEIKRLEGYRNFANKIWNASRFVLMHVENFKYDDKKLESHPMYYWIYTKLANTVTNIETHITQYRFDLAAQNIYEFIWNEYCDWFLEFAKPLLQNDKTKYSTQHTLLNVLEQALRALHPFMPFITESLWETIAPLINSKHTETIMLAPYPNINKELISKQHTLQIEQLKEFIIKVRTIRSQMNINPKQTITILLQGGNNKIKNVIKEQLDFILDIAKISSIEWLTDDATPPAAATQVLEDLNIFIPLAGIINKAEEQARLQREIKKLAKEILRATNKLDNPNYIKKAPKDVVAKEQAKLIAYKNEQNELQLQLGNIQSL